MLSAVVVLFVLRVFRSPPLAGAAVFAVSFPGLVVSPLAGTLLDRRGRLWLIRVDDLVTATAIALIAALREVGALSPAVLLPPLVLVSLTSPLSGTGMLSLFPLLVPRPL